MTDEKSTEAETTSVNVNDSTLPLWRPTGRRSWRGWRPRVGGRGRHGCPISRSSTRLPDGSGIDVCRDIRAELGLERLTQAAVQATPLLGEDRA
ncbi:hypothetical protein [Nocardia amamiensis]|uniref:hypothetical protein n=1 Tax=Nocardia amamiensis TaxID=404578 RepID=UPI001E2BF4F3|nr:hypothetical protein [Nocardia amamiensis]